MAVADTNQSSSSGGDIQTVAKSRLLGSDAPEPANAASGEASAGIKVLDTDSATKSEPVTTAQPGNDARKLHVDGRAVTEEEWLKAASENGYRLDYLRATPNYRPDINTKGYEPPKQRRKRTESTRY